MFHVFVTNNVRGAVTVPVLVVLLTGNQLGDLCCELINDIVIEIVRSVGTFLCCY